MRAFGLARLGSGSSEEVHLMRHMLLMLGTCVCLARAAQGQTIDIWLRAFIPDPEHAGAANGYIFAVPAADVGSAVRLRKVDGSAQNLCFATDGRGFSDNAASSA